MIALDELKKLPIEERWQIVEELTKSIEEERHGSPDPQWLIDEVMRRDAEYQGDPSSTIPWAVAREQIRSGCGY